MDAVQKMVASGIPSKGLTHFEASRIIYLELGSPTFQLHGIRMDDLRLKASFIFSISLKRPCLTDKNSLASYLASSTVLSRHHTFSLISESRAS
jgi:hypothetical protein